nr:MAG TPA: hypothetical protein [Caudoviricetes sp.]
MKIKHKVRIKIADHVGGTKDVLESTRISLPRKLLTLLFGEFCEVLVLTPGETVQGVEIQEVRGDGDE